MLPERPAASGKAAFEQVVLVQVWALRSANVGFEVEVEGAVGGNAQVQPVSRAEGKQHILPALILKSLQLCEKAMLQQVTIRSLPNVCALMLQTCTKSRMQQKARTRESNLCQQKLVHLVWADCGPTTIYRQSQMPSSPWAFKVARQTQQVCCRPHAPSHVILSILKPLSFKA